MSFAHPWQLLWLAAWAFLAAAGFWSLAAKKKVLARLIELNLIDKIFPFRSWRRWSFRRGLLHSAGLLFLILALCGPRIGQSLQEVKSKGGNVFILFDCSASMLAQDFKPDRMEKSKRLLAGLLEKLPGDRVGIIAFAGAAYVYCPLTFDIAAVRQFLRGVSADMIPQPGTHIGDAIRLALSKLQGSEGASALVLLTDGEDHHSDPLGAAEEARKAGLRIFAVGIGNPEGEPIPMMDANGKVTGFKRDRKGEIVMSRLDEATLAKMALSTGGSYLRASESEQEIDFLAAKLAELEKNPLTRKQNVRENRYQWFLALAFLCFLLGEAAGYGAAPSGRAWGLQAALSFLFIAGLAAPLRADSFDGRMREGNRLYQRKKYPEALEDYERAGQLKPQRPEAVFNKGDALYRMREWDQAAQAFQESAVARDHHRAADSFYNLGNCRFQEGQYAEAVKAYQDCLRRNPDDGDAKFNLRLALQLQKTPPPGQKQQKNQAKEEQEKRERQANAERLLKGSAGDRSDKPVFRPQDKRKSKKEYEEDW